MRFFPSLALLFALSGAAAAQQLFSWHTMDTGVTLKPGLELVLHQRLRMASGHPLEQERGGLILRYALHPKAVVYGGYYFQPQHTVDDRWIKGHRFFTGVETSRSLGAGLALTGRVAAERFHNAGRPDYNRYRSYVRLVIGRGRVMPYLQNEVLAVRYGFHSTRNSGGMRVRLSPALWFEVGGLYDFRQTEWGGDRVAVVTGLRWNPGSR